MKRNSLLVAMSFVLVLSMFLAACGKTDNADSGEGDGKPVPGGKITLSMFSPPKGIFNPIFYEDKYDKVRITVYSPRFVDI